MGLRLSDLPRELRTSASISGDPNVRITGFRQDSRRVEPGDLFAVRRGEKSDGAKHIAEALKRGAVAVLAERASGEIDAGAAPVVFVDDLRVALAFGSAAVYGHPGFSLDVIGVTGTNGKTTVTHLVSDVVDVVDGCRSCATIGTVGVGFHGAKAPLSHTTPEADDLARILARLRKDGASHVAMEVSSHALSQGRVLAVRFHVAAFTNLTHDHLDFHRTMEEYGAAKARLFHELAPATAVINVDDPFGAKLADGMSTPTLRVSVAPDRATKRADVSVRAWKQSALGIVAEVETPSGPLTVRSPLAGAHNLFHGL